MADKKRELTELMEEVVSEAEAEKNSLDPDRDLSWRNTEDSDYGSECDD